MAAPVSARVGARAHRPVPNRIRARRWLHLGLVALLVGAFGWVAPTAQADSTPTALIATTTTLTAPATGVLGDQLLLTATVTPSGATGTVDFFENDQPTTPCQDVPVAADGTAECQTRTLGIATYEFRADFDGDGEYADSSGSATTVIGRAPTSIEYTGPLTGTVGESVRLEAVLSVAGGEILHGFMVTFRSDGTSLCGAIESPDGTHWCFWTPPQSGTTTVTVDFSPGPFGDYEPASTDVQITVTDVPQQSPTTTVLTAPTTAEIGYPVTLTATVTPTPVGGTVDFNGDGAAVCSDRPVAADGAATCTVEGLAVGPHSFTAAFGGTDAWLPSTSDVAVVQVTKVLTDLSYSGDTSGTVGSPMDIAASLRTAVTGDPIGPGESITLSVDEQVICQQQTDASGRAGCQWTPSQPGSVSVSATYDGSSVYLPSIGSAPVSVDRKASTVTVTASPTSASWSDPIVVTANVTTDATGTVAFRTGAEDIAGCSAVPIGDATAQCAVDSLEVGNHTVTADYSGDAEHADSSGSTSVTVTARPTTVAYTGSTTGNVGAPLAVSATVLDEATSDPRSDATITFELGNASCQATTGENGNASCTITPTHVLPNELLVGVAADSHHAAAAITGLVQIQPGSTGVTVQAPDPIYVSMPATITAVVAQTDGGTVDFSVGQDPIAGCVGVAVTETDGQWSAACVTDALEVGDVTVTAAFSGTVDYLPATGSVDITVNKAPTEIAYTGGTNTTVDAPLQVSAKLTNVVGGGSESMAGQALTFALGDLSCTADTDESGSAACALMPTRTAQAGSLTVEFAGTATYQAATATAAVTVSPAPTTLTLTAPEQATYSAPVTLTAAVAPGNGEGTVDFAVADSPLPGCSAIAPELVDSAWQATCVTTELPVGEASVSASYSGTGDYLSSFDTATITVSPAATGLELAGPTTTSVGHESEFRARLTNLATGGPAVGLPVIFGWGDWACTATTDDEGFAACATTPVTVNQTGPLAVQFDGTTEFLSSTTTADITVIPAATSLTYTGPTTATAGVPFTVSAELAVVADNTAPDPSGADAAADAPRLFGARALALSVAPSPLSVAGKEIVFSAGSQQCIGRTDASGRAECRLTLVVAGPVTLEVATGATDQLAAAQVRASLDIAAAPVPPAPTGQTTTDATPTGPPTTNGVSTDQAPSDQTTTTDGAPTTDESTDPPVSPTTTRSTPTTTGAGSTVPAADGPDDPLTDPPLANTGSPVAPMVSVALLLLVVGAMVQLMTRRRPHPREH